MYCGTELWKNLISFQLTQQKLKSGREIEAFPNIPRNLYEALSDTAELHPDKTAIIDHYERPCSYSQLKKKVDDFSSYLTHKCGIGYRDRVALMLYNSLEFCVSFLSLMRIGAVTIPLPTKYKEQEVKSLIAKSDADYIVCDADFYTWFTSCEKEGVFILKSGNQELGYGFSDFICDEPLAPMPKSTREDTAILMFTSGTTSQSKGVVIKNYNIMHAAAVYQKLLNITDQDISIIPIPIYHITGIVALLGLFLYAGGTLYLHKYFDAARVLTCAQENHVTFLHASPTVFSMLLSEAESFPHLPDLKTFACGSSNMPKEKLRQIHEWLPHSTFHTVYGLTETTSPAAIFPGDASTSPFIGSSGLPVPGTCFKILDEDGNELPPDTVGEIWISGTVVLDSYYKIDTPSLKDGWLGTGDLGYFNAQGYLFVVDRKKDMINRGGEKIWSFDVENEIYRMKGVEDTAVVGIPDDIYGEVAAAVVKPLPGTVLTEDSVKNELKGRIATYKIPARVLIMDKIPVTPNGKVDKRTIKTLFLSKPGG